MEVIKIYAIDEEGLDNPQFNEEFKCDPAKETLESIRQKIAETQFVSDTPEKVTLIKRCKDQDEEEEMTPENLNKTLSEVLDEGDSLRYFVHTFARDLVKISLLIETKAIEWIANHSKDFKFLVGNTKDYQVTYKTNVLHRNVFKNIFFV